jgi:hypothetical protein
VKTESVAYCHQGLTLPSSGPAFGGPLKSNVRPRKKPLHEGTVVVRFTAGALSRRIQFAAGASPPRRSAKVALFLRHRRSKDRPAFAECVRWRWLESKQGRHVPWRRFRLGTKPRFKSVLLSLGQVAAIPRIHGRQPWRFGFFSQYQSTGSAQASLVQLAPLALVCFAIQMQTQTQCTAAAHRAWPNPSFKRTCLRHAA